MNLRSGTAALIVLATLSLPACVKNASGVMFDQAPQTQLAQGQARVYLYREKVVYLAQAPHVVSAEIEIDGRLIGAIKNGGFIAVVIPAGRHQYSAGVGANQTTWYLEAASGSTAYFQIWDKTRMEGARAASGLALGAAAGGLGGAVDAATDTEGPNTLKPDVKSGAVTGAITGGIQGAALGFRGRIREGEGRVWAVDLVGEGDALPVLKTLSVSD
jgi:hypothetical protein